MTEPADMTIDEVLASIRKVDAAYTNEEGAHSMTQREQITMHNDTIMTPLPKGVVEVKITRNEYGNSDSLHVWIKGDHWSVYTKATDDDAIARIHEIAAAVEAVK